MKNPYSPPKTSLTEESGIDGKTCPKCQSIIGLTQMLFASPVPNTYTCPNCKSKLRHNFSSMFVLYLFGVLVVFFLVTIVLLGELFGLKGLGLFKAYLIVAVAPATIVALLLLLYARKNKLLVLK